MLNSYTQGAIKFDPSSTTASKSENNMKTPAKILLSLSVSIFVTACGGGGGGGTPATVASTNTFNIQSGYTRLVAAGYSKTFSVSGTCTGTMTLTAGPATSATTFEGSPAIAGAEVGSFSWSGCTPSSGSTTINRYFDTSYNPKGFSIVGGDYAVYTTGPVIPATAKVGDVVIVGTLTKYTNTTKTTVSGRQENTMLIEPDTATTAIANLISKTYNASGILTSTEQDRYRMAADGTLTLLSFDIQYANGSTVHITGN